MRINIVSGEEFDTDIIQDEETLIIPFNEAMIEGRPQYPLFDADFILERMRTHQVDRQLYMQKMSPFLKIIENIKSNDELILWFGIDTFCQLNLLTVLAYLEQLGYRKTVIAYMIDEEKKVISEANIKIELGKFKTSYLGCFMQKTFISCGIDRIDQGIKEYFELQDKSSDIAMFIKDNALAMPKKMLFAEVFKRTRKYGLGDIQVKRLID